MPPSAPPMTSKQAKRLAKRRNGQYAFTPSQMRRADRLEELEKRRQESLEKEERKRLSKEKREEALEKQRLAKKRLLEEGKITLEDTWGSVTASQPRLNAFFKSPVKTEERPKSAPVESSEKTLPPPEEDKENRGKYDSQEDTLVDKKNAPLECCDLNGLSDADLLQLLSSPSCKSRSPAHKDRLTSRSPMNQSPRLPGIECQSPTSPSSSNRRYNLRSISSTAIQMPLDAAISPKKSRKRNHSVMSADNDAPTALCEPNMPVISVLEDHTAEALDQVAPELLEDLNLSYLSPSKSSRSALSEMSPGKVRQRANEKPDLTSVSMEDIGLATPSKSRFIGQDVSATDRASETDEVEIDDPVIQDKENSDPLLSPIKPPGTSKFTYKSPMTEAKCTPSSSRKPPPPSNFARFDDCEDLFDFDFETELNDDEHAASDSEDQATESAIDQDERGFEDEVQDSDLLSMASQRPASDRNNGKIRITQAPIAANKTMNPKLTAAMAPPPPKSAPPKFPSSKPAPMTKSTRTESGSWKLFDSFNSVDDEDLLDFADQVEEELSQRSTKVASKGKAKAEPANPPVACDTANAPGKALDSTGKSAHAGFKPPAKPVEGPMLKAPAETETRPKKRRTLPWEVCGVPPPSTLDVMMELVEEVEERME